MGVAHGRNPVQRRRLFGDHLGRWQQFFASAGADQLSRGLQAAHEDVLERQSAESAVVQANPDARRHRGFGVTRSHGGAVLRRSETVERRGTVTESAIHF